jgi:hypothetical protein
MLPNQALQQTAPSSSAPGSESLKGAAAELRVQRETMSDLNSFLASVVKAAVAELQAAPIPIHTFAFYHDHESNAVSVCADTKESSLRAVRKSNQWSMKYFAQHLLDGSWEDACLFQANVGRSLSLGDFTRVNLARTALPPKTNTDQSFYLAMARAVIAHQANIVSLAPDPEDVVFCCSSADSEVGLVWSALPNDEPSVVSYR